MNRTRTVTVFTTRPDTLFGATFFVLAPEHELVARLASDEVKQYVRRAAAKKTKDRAAADEKSGVDTGLHAINPVNGERIPIYVADYVLPDYGTGAIMAVPAHDQRDFEFARAQGLPIRQVVAPVGGEVDESEPYVEHSEGEVLVNSGEFDGLPADEGGRRIVERLERDGLGRFAVNFRLRDWGFSRQRYWGCPIPIVYCDTCGIVPVPESELPVVLPDIEDYMPKGRPPLAQAEDWVTPLVPRLRRPRTARDRDDGHVRRLVLVLPALLRPANDEAPFDRELVDYWNPVDLYIGGVDHATMHMIYARFWVKVLNDLGLVGFREPFASFFSNGWVTSGGKKISKRSGAAEGPTSSSSGTAPTPSGCASFSSARPTRTWSGPRRPSRRWRGSCADCGVSSTRWPSGRRTASRRAGRSRGRRTRRSRRSPTTSGGASRSTRRSRR